MDEVSYGEVCAGDRRVGVWDDSLSLSPRPADRGMPVDGVFQEKAGYEQVRSVVAKATMSAVVKLAMKVDVSASDVVFRHGVPPDHVVPPRPCRGEGTNERVLHGSSLSRGCLLRIEGADVSHGEARERS